MQTVKWNYCDKHSRQTTIFQYFHNNSISRNVRVTRTQQRENQSEILLRLQNFFRNTKAHNKYEVYLLKFHSISPLFGNIARQGSQIDRRKCIKRSKMEKLDLFTEIRFISYSAIPSITLILRIMQVFLCKLGFFREWMKRLHISRVCHLHAIIR